MRPLVVVLLISLGSVFMLLSAVGVVRLPDVFTRMHGMTKAATFGLGLLFVAAAIAMRDVYVAARSLAAIALILATMPVAAQLIARAAIQSGTCLWERTVINELEDHIERDGPPEEPL